MIGSPLYRHGPIILVIPQSSSSRLFFLHHMAPYRWGLKMIFRVAPLIIGPPSVFSCAPCQQLLYVSIYAETEREREREREKLLSKVSYTHKLKTTIEFGLAGPRKRAALSLYIDWTKVWNFLLPDSQTRLTPSSFLSLSLYTSMMSVR